MSARDGWKPSPVAAVTTVLVAMDFCDPSMRALHRAADVALAFGAKLVVLHVVDIQSQAYAGALFVPLFDNTSERVDAATVRLDELVRMLPPAIRATRVLRYGVPAEEIVEGAVEEKASLVVMGTHGGRGLEHFLLGSVAEKVVRTATVPVLTVH